MEFLKKLFGTKVSIHDVKPNNKLNDLIIKVNSFIYNKDIEDTIKEPDCVLVCLLVHSKNISDIRTVSRTLFYNTDPESNYMTVHKEKILISLELYLNIGLHNYIPIRDILIDIELILNNYKDKKELTALDKLIYEDINTFINTLNELIN